MKLKRFLSLFVATIMVLAMVPAMSVSAAGTTGVIDALGGEVLWSCPDGSFNDTAIGTAFSGWSSNITSGYVNVKTYSVGNVIQYYVNGTANVTTITSPGYGGNGEDAIVIEWKMKRQNPSDLYFDFSFTDKNGTEIAFLKLDRNYTSVSGEYYMGYPADGTDCAIVATNNGDGTHKVEYYVGGSVVSTVASKAGEVNGFGGITSSNGRWSAAWNHIGFADLTIGAVSFSETRVDVTAEYTVNGEVVHTETGNYDPAEGETGVTFPAYAYSANGSNVMYATDGATLSESGTIEMTAVANTGTHAVGDIFAKDGVQYEIKSANLVPNGEFTYGLAGWYNAANGVAGADKFTVNSDGTITGKTNEGTAAAGSLHRAWALESGKQYLFTWTADVDQTYHKVSVKDELTGTADGTVVATSVAGTNNYVFTAANNYIQINFRWLGSSNVIGHFGLYEIEEAEVAVTETVASVDTIAGVTVIGDTAVVLPSTVAVTGSLGTEVNAPIAWDMPGSYDVGTVTVTGTATVQFGTQDATEETVSTTVTVLEETFTIEDFNSVNGQDAAKAEQKEFPVALTDTFFVEFVANYASFGDLFITMKTKDAGFFGPEQIALGANASGGFRPVNGNGSGGRAVADSDHATLTAGQDYRFLVAAMPATNQYSVMVYDAATGVAVANAEYYGFRTNSGSIEVITALTNNGQGSIALSDIKVNAPGVEKTEYTFNITLDGETSTTTASYWSDEEAIASVADIEGYEKTVSIDGTTVTVVYSATKVVTVTFVTADETVVYEVTEEVQLNESVTVAEKEIYDAVTCAYYTIPETVAETTTVVTVAANTDKIAVVADAFHNSSDAQPWNNDENMLFVGSAGVTNTDDVDANGENVTNKTDGGNLGSARVALVKFPVPEVSENQAVKLHVYAAKANQNLGNGNWMKIAANVSEVEANETENAFVAGDLANLDGIVWSDNAASAKADPVDGRMDVNEWMEIDVTNFVKAATGETITFALYAPTAGFYVADREKAVAGGAYEGKAAYLTLEDAFVVTETGYATLTKNGSAMTTAYVTEGDDVRLVADGAVVIGTDAGYYPVNENLNLTEATTFENTVPAGFGLAMVDGGQVRIGDGVDENGKIAAGSGIRFLATADYADTVIADANVEYGLKVTAEGSTQEIFIPATSFQDEYENVFTVAITNLAVSNYNRNYTATPYAKVTMADGTVKTILGDTSVTRSVYQVSAGIMKNGSANTDYDNAIDATVKAVLNAYVNMVGVRVDRQTEGSWTADDVYTGDVFFTVESTTVDNVTTVTVTPDSTWAYPVEIADFWADYVRIDNNHSAAVNYIDGTVDAETGVLTFTFTVPAE